jgi:hypothetical protein
MCPYVTFDEYFTRMTLAHFMRTGGFRLLRTENWHGSFGDRGLGLDGPLRMSKAMYGPIDSFDGVTGEIVPYDPDSIERPFLTPDETKNLAKIARIKPRPGEPMLSNRKVVNVFRNLRTNGNDWSVVKRMINLPDDAAIEGDDEQS